MTKLLGSLWATQIFLKNFQGLLDAVCGGFAQIAKAPFFMCLPPILHSGCLSQQALQHRFAATWCQMVAAILPQRLPVKA